MRRAALASAILLLALALAQPARDALREAVPRTPSAPSAEGLAGSVLAGSFRPLLLTYLWLRGDVLYGEGRDDECFDLYRALYGLYPDNLRAREFLGWFLAFNLKRKAPDPALGWKWAEAGLDMLLDLPAGPTVVVDWIRKQCGQNSLVLQRYAGPAWEEERAWRVRLRAFGARRYGAELSRFALGLRVLEGKGQLFADRIRRALLLWSLAYEEFLGGGAAPHAKEAVAALRAVAREIEGDDGLAAYFDERARCLEAVAEGRVPEPLPEHDAYPVAMALLGRGAHAGDPGSLAAAESILVALGEDGFRPEIALVRAWRAHLETPGAGQRPALPLDGVR